MKNYQLLIFKILAMYSLLIFSNGILQAGTDKCVKPPQQVLQELVGKNDLSDLLAQLKKGTKFVKYDPSSFNLKFHNLLMDISKLSDADRIKLLQQLEKNKFYGFNSRMQELIRLAAYDVDEWGRVITKSMKDIYHGVGSATTNSHGVYSSLYYILNKAPAAVKKDIQFMVKRNYSNADRIEGEVNARASLRQIILALDPPQEKFAQLLSSKGAKEAYLTSVRSTRAPVESELGELNLDTVFSMTNGIQRGVDWGAGQVDEVLFVGSYPNGFAKVGQSDIDIHFIKTGETIDHKQRRKLVSAVHESLYDVFVRLRLGNMPVGDDIRAGDPRDFFNRSPFTFRVTKDKIILRVNKPQLKINEDGNPANQVIQFEEFEILE